MEHTKKTTSKPYLPEFRKCAVRLAMEHRDKYQSEAAALTAIAGTASRVRKYGMAGIGRSPNSASILRMRRTQPSRVSPVRSVTAGLHRQAVVRSPAMRLTRFAVRRCHLALHFGVPGSASIRELPRRA